MSDFAADLIASIPVTLDALTVFRALASPIRWKMIQNLSSGRAIAATEMKKLVGTSLFNVTQHLHHLRDAGLISWRIERDGRMPLYYIPRAFRERPNALDFGSCVVRVPGAVAAFAKD